MSQWTPADIPGNEGWRPLAASCFQDAAGTIPAVNAGDPVRCVRNGRGAIIIQADDAPPPDEPHVVG